MQSMTELNSDVLHAGAKIGAKCMTCLRLRNCLVGSGPIARVSDLAPEPRASRNSLLRC